ncbi:helix-turn-helix domain-containing protein [Nonomuraea zeae]|uniref:Helix-turn-helix transcriptional regulator n=1 Tax=Nonomuraea zeae TaxID=1642303 RepID=A0A5S4GYN1_9ACTN|nr:helix-turn-helix transcriptional regulator [Nonomuraea zeae]TMR37782.1 helix-turn-helix transcriptional regulator [Nonomuraea zeae]
MSVDDDARTPLARRLRELRSRHWPDQPITQAQLGEALGVSVPLISSWESRRGSIPPSARLETYAAFFATRRSVSNGHTRVLPLSEMTPEEADAHGTLLAELTWLRQEALRLHSSGARGGPAPAQVRHHDDPLQFGDGEPITIICSQVPEEDRAKIPYASPLMPDYIELYRYSDLDSLFELHGHLRAANPTSLVALRSAEDLRSDDLTTHLVLLGGVDYNEATASMLERIALPVRQVADWDKADGAYFEVRAGRDTRRHYPVVKGTGDSLRLLEDVAFFYRGVNPDNVERTLTICNGMYARGVYGAVRALTDDRFRRRNATYLRARFDDAKSYGILARVRITGNVVVTPDWTLDSARLHEWSEPTHGD